MVTNTYWYLTGVPELMAVAACKFESFVPSPEARHAWITLHRHLRSHRWSNSSSQNIWSPNVL
jgi:hypothetical protein